jgi:molecular chaperone GrpE
MKKDNGTNNEKDRTPPAQDAPVSQQPKKEADSQQGGAGGRQDDYQALWAKYVRACADFENTRKRWEREREETLKFGNVVLLRELIVVLDEMAQALKLVKVHNDSVEIAKGLEMMYNTFFGVLKKQGLSIIETAGKKFDPHLHEIVATREVPDMEEPTILEEVQRGYFLEDKVLRASKVIVGLKKQDACEHTPAPEGGAQGQDKTNIDIEKTGT